MADIILGQHPLLKKEFVDKRIKQLAGNNFVADKLLTKTTVDALSIKYRQDADADSLGRQAYDEMPQVGEGSNFLRVGLNEVEKQALIKKYGLEFVVTYEMQKFGTDSQFERGFRKLAQNMNKMVDTMAYNVITGKFTVGANGSLGRVKTGAAQDVRWTDPTNGAEQMIADLVDAKTEARKYGYTLNTVSISPETEAMLIKNTHIRDAFRQNNTDVALLRGYIGDFMGLSFITDENFKDNNVLLTQRGIIGDLADAEGLRTKTYNEDSNERTIVRATRFTEAYLTDPKAVYLLQGIKA